MKYILLFSFTFASVTSFTVTNNDTTFVNKYHKNGVLKTKGIKLNDFKHGSWYHYCSKGTITKVERYMNGKIIKTLNIGESSEKKSTKTNK